MVDNYGEKLRDHIKVNEKKGYRWLIIMVDSGDGGWLIDDLLI